jgi:hypothetical protein
MAVGKIVRRVGLLFSRRGLSLAAHTKTNLGGTV